jgi:hypothetical protein
MSWDAVEALDDALDETRDLLLPFDLGTWLRLAVITAFAGLSAPQTPTFSWEVQPDTAARVVTEVTVEEVLAVLVVVGTAVVVVGAVVSVIGAVMEFVLVDVLRSREVALRAPFRRWLGPGLRLFGFRLAIVLLGLLAAAGIAGPVLLAFLTGSLVWLLALAVTLPLALLLGAASALASEFTTAFVVPLMMDDGVGITEGWRTLWPHVRADWRQFAVYVLVKAVLLFGASFVLGFAVAVVAVPLGVGGVLAGALSGAGLAALAVAALVGIVVLAAVSVPTMTYLRYHSLLTLDRTDVSFSFR